MEVRNYTEADFADYLRLRNELDIHGQVLSAKDLRAVLDLPWVTPEKDVLIVLDGADAVGYAVVQKSGNPTVNRHYFLMALAEEFRGEAGLVDGMISKCEARIREIAEEYGGSALQIRAGCYEEETWFSGAFERKGYVLTRYFARMDLNDLGALKKPEVPEGVVVRPFDRARETPEFVEAFNRGFVGHFEHTPEPPENFEVYFNTHWYRPDLVFVAEAAGELVGVSWNYMMSGPEADGFLWGVVGDLAVVAEHRGRGLGRALLRRAQLALQDAGAQRICLWVDYTNPFGAKKLYYGEGYVDRYITRSYAKDN